MNKRLFIYPVDESSIRWLIINELMQKKYKFKFIIRAWDKRISYGDGGVKAIVVDILVMNKNNYIKTIFIDENKLLKLTRKVKLKHLNNDIEEYFTYEQKISVTKMRLETLHNRVIKFYNHHFSPEVRNYNQQSPLNLKKLKRQKLAKENKGCGKAKNK